MKRNGILGLIDDLIRDNRRSDRFSRIPFIEDTLAPEGLIVVWVLDLIGSRTSVVNNNRPTTINRLMQTYQFDVLHGGKVY
jgi:hypothetical protein